MVDRSDLCALGVNVQDGEPWDRRDHIQGPRNATLEK